MSQIREEVSFTKGRIIVRGKLVSRGKAKRADYVLYYKPNIPLALIEAKDNSYGVGDGMQQGLDYATTLHIPFVFSSNGDVAAHLVVETAQPIELRDDDRAFQPAGHLESRGKLRPALKRVSTLGGFDLGESIYDVAALGSGKPRNGITLGLEVKPRGALLLGADPDIGEDRARNAASCALGEPARVPD